MENTFGIGDKLARLRSHNKLTLDEVAEGLGVPRSTYYDYEQGNVLPKLDFIQKAAAFYKVDPMVFFSGTNLSITQQHNEVANGYIQNQHHTDQETLNTVLAHLDEHQAA